MTWNYRFVKEKDKPIEGQPETYTYSIRDVYYDKNGKPYNCGAEPQSPLGETFNDLIEDYQNMGKAFGLKVLELKGDELIEGKLTS